MTRRTLIIDDDDIRSKALTWVKNVAIGTVIEFRQAKRSTEQSDKMWAMLGDVSKQTDWHGHKLSDKQWKILFMKSLNSEMFVVPSLDGREFVDLGTSTRELSKSEMSDLIEVIYMFGATRNVKFMNERIAA
jgi:NinB protein